MQIKQGIYEVACCLVQYNKINLKAISKLTVYNVQRGCFFLDSSN